MRVAKDTRREHRAVSLNLRRSIETGPGVVEIHLVQVVESAELPRPEVVQDRRLGVFRVGLEKGVVSGAALVAWMDLCHSRVLSCRIHRC